MGLAYHHRVRLLWLLESEVLPVDALFHRCQLPRRPWISSVEGPPRAAGTPRRPDRGRSRAAGLVQVRRFRHRELELDRGADGTSAAGATRYSTSHRDLVLHVPHHHVHCGRLPRNDPAHQEFLGIFLLCVLVLTAGGGTDRSLPRAAGRPGGNRPGGPRTISGRGLVLLHHRNGAEGPGGGYDRLHY